MDNKYRSLFTMIILFAFSSCVNSKKIAYINEAKDLDIEYKVESLEPKIQKNDILSIVVSSLNAEANQLFNLYPVSSAGGNMIAGTVIQASGFLVDQDGRIQFPMLGSIQAAGLTKKQLKELITNGLKQKELLLDPVVNIRYLNYKITVLGEVKNPAVFNVPNEKITLLEALGLAGDLTIFARREDVVLIREEKEGRRIYKHLNLNDKDFLTSPYYYLQSNDIVYAAPNKANVANASTAKPWLPTVFSALSLAVVVVDRLIKK